MADETILLAAQRHVAWLSSLGVGASAPTAASLGFKSSAAQVRRFFLEIKLLPDGEWLLNNFLPPLPLSDWEKLAQFCMLSVHPGVEEAFLKSRKRRGARAATALRKNIRMQRVVEGDQLARCEKAFDTRRRNLSGFGNSMHLTLQSYLLFRSNGTARRRHLHVLLTAACIATSNVRIIDARDLSRTLNRLRKKHPNLYPPGHIAARIIELH